MKNILKSDFLSSRVQYIPLERIVPNPHQPRRDFDPEGLQELAASIRQYGILQPATVRTRLRRGRLKLKDLLGGNEDGE